MDGIDSGRKPKTGLRLLSESRNLKLLWSGSVAVSGFYMLFVYLFPNLGLNTFVVVPNRGIVEIMIGILPMISAGALTYSQLEEIIPEVSISDEFTILTISSKHIGIIALKISAVSDSLVQRNGDLKYNSTPLLAIRAGMGQDVNYAFQYGVQSGEPFFNLYISAISTNLENLKEILRREATRTEAIFLSSLQEVNIEVIRTSELHENINRLSGINIDSKEKLCIKNERHNCLLLRGEPKVTPTNHTSQAGTFISTALRQGFSISLTSVFSKTKAGKENRQLERKWRKIKAKEKRNEESLAEQAMKKSLLDQYEEISENSGWFESSTYVVFDDETPIEGVEGLIHSVWSGDKNLELEMFQPSRLQAFKLLTKRHVKKQRLHVSRLVAYINTPVQRLPVLSGSSPPEFQIPPTAKIENDLHIGWAVYGNRRLSSVGIKLEWLREHMAVLGATGTGKTTLVKRMMSEISRKTNVPWWIFDVKGSEYGNLDKFPDVSILRPGLDPNFIIDLIESKSVDSNRAYSTFSILRELIQESSSDLSPAMETLLREAIQALTKEGKEGFGASALIQKVDEISRKDRTGKMTRDALINRLEILVREPLGSIFAGGEGSFQISSMLSNRIVFDLRYVSQIGGMDAARLLYNLVVKRIFNASMKRGISSGLHHLVVLEEASNLVPESYTRHSAADVSTGESMVMLQRATGQGVIVVSTRPNISSNILANTSTKVAFKLPFDSSIGAKFMSLDSNEEHYLRTMQRGRALLLIPNCNTFEIETDPFDISEYSEIDYTPISTTISDEMPMETQKLAVSAVEEPLTEIATQTTVFDRFGELANHVIAFLASNEITTHENIIDFLHSLDARISDEDVNEILRDLVSLSTIQREAIPLAAGGFVYASPGKGLSAVRNIIINYLKERLESIDQQNEEGEEGPDLLVNETAIVIVPQRLKSSSLDSVIEMIRRQMKFLRNSVTNLVVIVRGSVAAAKLREFLDRSEEFDAVSVLSAFPSSISKLVEDLTIHRSRVEPLDLSSSDPEAAQVNLLEAVHDIGSASSRAVQMRLWFGLIQDFVDLSKGLVSWESILEFIDTTALQSRKGRSTPLNIEEGKRALTELLADEVLIAIRTGSEDNLMDLEEGLWIVNTDVLEHLKRKAIDELRKELEKRFDTVSLGHGYYDICANMKSYVVFPTQQELSTLIRLHSDVACRKCDSREVICILTATEYLEDSIVTPSNLIMRTMDEGLASIFI